MKLESSKGPHGSFEHRVKEASSGETTATSIDKLAETLALQRVDWIKIDVEGAEVAVLEGAQEVLRRFKPTIWMELHDTWAEVETFLTQHGYTICEKIEKNSQGLYRRTGYLWAEPVAAGKI
ncbi:MAG: FkbM family methyltransferase [Bacteroidia bacterium]|nr:FkbM family methyltransferase [Bacteroidia bacterium]